jgi:hypothetical protein
MECFQQFLLFFLLGQRPGYFLAEYSRTQVNKHKIHFTLIPHYLSGSSTGSPVSADL